MNGKAEKIVGTKIRKLREGLGISQEEFAERVAMHRSHMGEIERGETNITLSTLLQIARGLKVAPGSLLHGVS